jgi:hypothetical protein
MFSWNTKLGIYNFSPILIGIFQLKPKRRATEIEFSISFRSAAQIIYSLRAHKENSVIHRVTLSGAERLPDP